MDKKSNCLILNLWSCTNYGASLTSWGVQCLVEKLGYNAQVINYKPKIGLPHYGTFAETFAQKYLNLTEPVNNYNDFIALNNIADNFIVGSDQVWNPGIMNTHHSGVSENIYLLDFVQNGKKKLSYSASFGKAKFLNPTAKNDYKETFKYFINQFDDISVREDDGQVILEQLFGVKSTQLIDGAFNIPKEKLEEMTKNFTSDGKYIGCYALPYFSKQKWYEDILSKISEKTGLPIKKLEFNTDVQVEEWLAFIKNAEFMITDSYHALVFSIIFNTPFLQVKNAQTQSRFESLFRLFETENNSIGQNDSYDLDKILAPVDWDKINTIIDRETTRAQLWMKNAIENSKNPNSYCAYINYFISKSSMQDAVLKRKLHLLANKGKFQRKYYLYKVLSSIAFGGLRKKFKQKRKKYKALVKEIRNF
ncbi:MAG: polysaccharide pyruvyl transferase family protein [Muribaculaceae bacterium]|nr:polysaccharide pyruvyl transferase family protein [Muribaculaceae bacterium]